MQVWLRILGAVGDSSFGDSVDDWTCIFAGKTLPGIAKNNTAAMINPHAAKTIHGRRGCTSIKKPTAGTPKRETSPQATSTRETTDPLSSSFTSLTIRERAK